jgi:hypothetical protein
MTETFFPTSTPSVAEETANKIIERQGSEIIALRSNLDSMTSNLEYAQKRIDSLNGLVTAYTHRIQNVKDYITEVYIETDDVPDELNEIAKMLQIRLTKPISGTATFSITWRAEVPLDFDPDDMELSFSVDCQSDVEDFEYDEEDTEIRGEGVF